MDGDSESTVANVGIALVLGAILGFLDGSMDGGVEGTEDNVGATLFVGSSLGTIDGDKDLDGSAEA